ncbi:MAG: mannitol dehydrogenase family protein [Lachnospiraceae bacterium]|nr:mannitol dehydrogenase family protein [Lachnospiraceae bacterium]
MLNLKTAELQNKEAWEKAGIALPQYDVEAMRAKTEAAPTWVHFGAGNIFRGFIARLQQDLLNQGLTDTGIVAVETFDFDVIDKIYKPYDSLALVVGMKADGKLEKNVVASIAEGVKADSSDATEMAKLEKIFVNPSLQMMSFTITEKGYALTNMEGKFFPVVESDIAAGPNGQVKHAMSVVASLLYKRFKAGKLPMAVVSMDNCSHNGEKLQKGVMTVAKAWAEKGLVEADFIAYLEDEKTIAFPWSMIDKITPRPSKVVEEELEKSGVADMAPVVTSKNTFIAPFVNCEIPEYLVVEDKFPNGRPALEKAGVYMTDRDTVNNTERMKVTTCLNPLHTALAVYGCVLGYNSIASEMKDAELKAMVEKIGYEEGMPVVVDPKILKPMDFIHEVIDERLPNPFIPDMPQRIATDTSQKIAIRFGETIKSYIAREDLDAKTLTFIPLAIAGWFRYLLAVDDEGKAIEVSSDPMKDEMQQKLSDIKFGDQASYNGELKEILKNTNLFATDLTACGLADKIEAMFVEEIAGPGAVRATLKKYLQK